MKVIKEHNASESSYIKGLNHLSDMTSDEVRAYYNLKNITPQEMKNAFRSLRASTLDDFNDDEVSINFSKVKISEASTHPIKDSTSIMLPVRDQGGCGSCWAFTTQSSNEGVLAATKDKPSERLSL